jgi:steroid delta-isomerase-like uncharacterized protein
MSERSKALVRRWFEEVWNQGRREVIAEMLAPDAVIHDGGMDSVGPEGFYPFYDRMHTAFSDIRLTIQDFIAERDKVCVRWSSTVTHTGDFLGMPPTNKRIEITGMTVARVARGKLVEGWQNWDMLGLKQKISGEPMAQTYIAADTTRANVTSTS